MHGINVPKMLDWPQPIRCLYLSFQGVFWISCHILQFTLLVWAPWKEVPSGSASLFISCYLYCWPIIRLKVSKHKFRLCCLFPKVGDTSWKYLEGLLNISYVWRSRRNLFPPVLSLLNDILLWHQLLLLHRPPTETSSKKLNNKILLWTNCNWWIDKPLEFFGGSCQSMWESVILLHGLQH